MAAREGVSTEMTDQAQTTRKRRGMTVEPMWVDDRYLIRGRSGRVIADNFKCRKDALEWIEDGMPVLDFRKTTHAK